MKDNGKYFYVIEGDGCYWTGNTCTQASFSGNIHDAIKFHDEGSAQTIKHWLLAAFNVGLRVTQHAWIKRQA